MTQPEFINQKYYCRYSHNTRETEIIKKISWQSFHLFNVLITCSAQIKNWHGIIYATRSYLTYASKMPLATLNKALYELLQANDPADPTIFFEEELNLFWLQNYTKHQCTSTNHLVAAIKSLADTPLPEYVFNAYLIKYGALFLERNIDLPNYREPKQYILNLNEFIRNPALESETGSPTQELRKDLKAGKDQKQALGKGLPSTTQALGKGLPSTKKSTTQGLGKGLPSTTQGLDQHSPSTTLLIINNNNKYKSLILRQRKELKEILKLNKKGQKQDDSPEKEKEAGKAGDKVKDARGGKYPDGGYKQEA